MQAIDNFNYKWVLGHGLARLHKRGRVVGCEHGPAGVSVLLHPCFTVFNWDAHRSGESLNERQDRTTEAEPAVVPFEPFCWSLQPEGWPEGRSGGCTNKVSG